MVRLELLHLHIADIRNNEILDRSQIGLIGLRCPLVLVALLGKPLHQNSLTVMVDGIRKVPFASSCSICFLRFVASSFVEKLSYLLQFLPCSS